MIGEGVGLGALDIQSAEQLLTDQERQGQLRAGVGEVGVVEEDGVIADIPAPVPMLRLTVQSYSTTARTYSLKEA